MATVRTDSEALQNIADNVRRLLRERGMRQTELARLTNETDTRISYLVAGKKMPSAAFLARVAESLGTTVDDLLSAREKISS